MALRPCQRGSSAFFVFFKVAALSPPAPPAQEFSKKKIERLLLFVVLAGWFGCWFRAALLV
jgi:hypothetical protein